MAKEAPSPLPSLFSSLPNDILINVLACVPIRYHPILSCVSKQLRSLVRSWELHKTRSLMGKDCFYICFEKIPDSPFYTNLYWFSLTENRRLVPIPFRFPGEVYRTALMLGPEIYFIGRDYGYKSNPWRRTWILDSRSGKLRQGPNTLVARGSPAMGIVDEKIYIFGGECEKNQAQVFDPKTHTWQIATNPKVDVSGMWMSVVSPSLDRKIYARNIGGLGTAIVYDPRDGNCESIKLPTDTFNTSDDVCVIDNLLYVYDYTHCGLMWYNSKEKEWRAVLGLKHHVDYMWGLTISEYNGKIAFLWHDREKMEIWCSMIGLRRCGVAEVQGWVEWSNCLLSDVPNHYKIKHCLGRTD